MNARAVLPRVIAADSEHVLTFFDIRRQVEAAGHDAVLGESQVVTVQIEVGPLTHALELDKELTAFGLVDIEGLTIPADGVGQVDDVFLESLVAVEGIGQRDALPLGVIVVGAEGL